MSLINDLFLEVDRRERAQTTPGLSPLRARPPRKRRGPKRDRGDWLRPAVALVAVGSICVAAVRLEESEVEVVDLRPVPTAEENASVRPAVSAEQPPAPARATLAPALATPDAPAALTRNRIHRLSTEPLPRGVRLRVEADRVVAHQLHRGAGSSSLEIVLEQTRMDEPMGPLELTGTPIEAFQVRTAGTRLHLHLDLREVRKIEERWSQAGDRAAFLVDLERAPLAERGTAAEPEARKPPGVDAPEIATAPALEIQPSASDRRRREDERRRAAARKQLQAARLARDHGDLDRAIARYRDALALAPGRSEAGAELVDALLKAHRIEDAMAVVESAREARPADPGWAMLHAKVLAQRGDHDAAVALLDAAGKELQEAPELHALAAAYAQRAGDHESARDRYEVLLRYYPGRAALWMGLGISLEALARPSEAADVYRIAIEMGGLPSSSRAWVTARVASLREEG